MSVAPLDAGSLGRLQALAANLVNAARATSGLAPLALDAALCQAAQDHAVAMAGGAPYAHTTPGGVTSKHRIVAASGHPFAHTAENIARIDDTASVPSEAHVHDLQRGWMGSPDHRAAILSPAPAVMGFGIAGAGASVFAVQTFAGPGAPRGLVPGQTPRPIAPAEAATALIGALNQHRAAPLSPSPALAHVAEALLPADIAKGAVTSTNLFALLPLPEQPLWRDIATCTALCSACGDRLSDIDIADFAVDIVRAEGSTLTAPVWEEAGAAFAVDGAGWKLVVVVLGRRF